MRKLTVTEERLKADPFVVSRTLLKRTLESGNPSELEVKYLIKCAEEDKKSRLKIISTLLRWDIDKHILKDRERKKLQKEYLGSFKRGSEKEADTTILDSIYEEYTRIYGEDDRKCVRILEFKAFADEWQNGSRAAARSFHLLSDKYATLDGEGSRKQVRYLFKSCYHYRRIGNSESAQLALERILEALSDPTGTEKILLHRKAEGMKADILIEEGEAEEALQILIPLFTKYLKESGENYTRTQESVAMIIRAYSKIGDNDSLIKYASYYHDKSYSSYVWYEHSYERVEDPIIPLIREAWESRKYGSDEE